MSFVILRLTDSRRSSPAELYAEQLRAGRPELLNWAGVGTCGLFCFPVLPWVFPTPMLLLVFPLDHSDHSHRLCLTCPAPVPCCVWICLIPELADVPSFRRGHARLPAFLLPFMFSHVFGCSYFWRLDFSSLPIYVDPDFVCIKSDFPSTCLTVFLFFFYQMQHFKFLTLQPVMDTLVNFLLPLNIK